METTTAWPKVKLADCVDLLAGFAFKSDQFTDKPDDVALVKGENVSQGQILWDISKRWPVADWQKLEKFQLAPGDVVVAMDRPWVPAGLKWAFIRKNDPKALLVQRCSRLRTSNGKLDQDFLRFVIGGPIFESYVKPITTGVNVPHISGRQILDFAFTLPPVPVQRRIADILSAYDELMENCQRRIRILEEMARALYREWFVHFRFPGHEKVPRVSSAFGEIPKGWEIATIDGVCERVTDGAHASPKSVDEGLPMASSKDMHDWGLTLETCRYISTEDFAALVRNDCKPKKNDILITKDGANYLKRIFVVREESDIVLLSSIAILRPNQRINPHLLAAILKEPENRDRLKGFVTGAAIPRIILKDFKQFQFLLPPKALQREWAKTAEPITALIWRLIDKAQNLRRTRDLLLPRLLSGQVSLDVSAVEDVAEPTAPAPPRAAPRSQTPFGNALAGETPFRGGGERRANAERATELPGQLRSQTEFGNEEPDEQPASRAAEEAPPYRVERTGRPGLRAKGAASSQPGATPQVTPRKPAKG